MTAAARGAGAAALLWLAAPVAADPDLALHPVQAPLHMRVKRTAATAVVAATAEPGAAHTPGSTTPAHTSAPSPADAARFHPLPTSLRDLQDRVSFKVNAGYELDAAPASGEPLRGGSQLASGFNNTRSWIVGDAVVGAHDLVLPSLGGYFLAGFQLDAGDSVASRSATVVPADATDQRVAIKAGYAEYQTDDQDDHHVWLRAGRQYRIDGGAMFAYFDGGTIGYRSGGISASAFGGERVALYVDTPRGQTFGATAAIDLKRVRGVPIKLAVDYLGLAIGINDGLGAPGSNVTQFRDLLAASGNIDVSPRAHLDVSAPVVDGGDGWSFGRVDARLRYAIGRDIMAAADIAERGGGDLAFDLASPTAADVVDLSRRLGVGLVAPTTSTIVGAHVDWRHGYHEVLAFARANLAEGTVTSVDQESWAEGGVAVAGAPIASVWATLQYTLRDYFLRSSANLAGSAFDDTAGSGLGSMHELSLDGWWRGPAGLVHRLRVGGGLFYRIYDFATPYVDVSREGRGGGRVDVQWLLATGLHAMAGAEVAQSSPTVMREIGTLSSFRIALEARW